MNARIGDEIMIMPQGLHQPVRDGQIRESSTFRRWSRVDPGPPVGLDIRILPGQSPDDFSAHAAAIAYDLGMADVRIVPLGPSAIRLELLPHNRRPGPASR